MSTRVGTALGRYQIKSEIGRGSMGVVYRAWDPKIDRTVAIKTVSLAGLDLEGEREYRARFVVEAQSAGRLSHAGIVTVFDVAEEAATGAPYLVMEHVEGESLDQLLRGENNHLPLAAALQLVQELAEALHYAHAQGVVHRDIKPANILVTADGHAKIADFGIARLNQTQLTQHGQVLGSPAYMAPEQLSDEGVDSRSDLFSLGVVLYFMLTGHRPFQGNSIATVCFKVANHVPLAVATYDLTFPKELDVVVSRAIAKHPNQRYQTGAEMASDIRRLRESCGFIQSAEAKLKSASQPAAVPLQSTTSPSPHGGKLSASGVPIELRRPLATLRGRVLFSAAAGVLLVLLVFSRPQKIELPAAVPEVPHSEAPHPVAPRPVVSRPAATVQETTFAPAAPPAAPPAASPVTPTTNVDLEIDHPFVEARASMWLDNQLVYTQVLHADPHSHLLVFRKTQGHESRRLELKSGKHQVKLRVQSPAASYDQSRILAVNFAPKAERTLHISCDKKHNSLQVTLQ